LEHLKFDDYLAALTEDEPFRLLHLRAHRHLVEVCEACGEEWPGALEVLALPPVGSEAKSRQWERVADGVPSEDREVGEEHYDACRRWLSLSRDAGRLAREDMKLLLRLRPGEWRGRIDRARSRFRSRAFGEALLQEARTRVRDSPREAAALAALVEPALARIPERDALPWVRTLVARAEAHRANALRIAGDLPAARAAFDSLRPFLPELDAVARGEILRLEASLLVDQRQVSGAFSMLNNALEVSRQVGDDRGVAFGLVQLAYLHQVQGQPARAPDLLRRALPLFDPDDEPYLYTCAVHGLVNVLLDLERFAEAAQVLGDHEDAYLDRGDPHLEATYRGARARIDLGQGRHAEAEAGFREARRTLLDLGRNADAAMASLYLADTLLADGNVAELRSLAQDLVELFRGLGMDREAMGSVRLLAEAAGTEAATRSLVARLRESLEGGRPAADC